ncbi:MAG TPA: PKD domain-containing protein [Frankiaceae bacterium]|nr:PKD domain-containing protein [Frankiaceae bacterium]
MRASRWAAAAVAVALAAGGVTAAVRLRAGDAATAGLATSPLDAPLITAPPAATTVPSPTGAATTTPPATPVATPAPTRPGATAPVTVPTAVPTGRPLPVTNPTRTAPADPATPTSPPPQGHWTHSAGGVSLDVRISPTHPRAGQLVTWTVTMRSTGAECCGAQILYGDNQGGPESDRYCLGYDPYPKTATGATQTFRHAYRRGAVYTPWIHVMNHCNDGPLVFTYKPTLRVGDGPLLSNGPWVPVGSVDDSVAAPDGDPDAGQYFVAQVFDHDGFPVSWQWDFGDGTRQPVTKNPDACRWPEDGGWIESSGSSHLAHRFPGPGTYTVRFTATTAGCDGRNPQSYTVSMKWTVDEARVP